VRRAQYQSMSSLLERLRWKIVNLWMDLNVPLVYRAKFWLVFEGVSFLNLGVHQEELLRLENMHRLPLQRGPSNSISSGTSSKKQVKDIASEMSAEKAKQALAQERLTLKHLLKDARDPIKQSLFVHEMNYAIGDKKKKERLLSSIWSTRAPDVSEAELKAFMLAAAGDTAAHAASHVDRNGGVIVGLGESKRSSAPLQPAVMTIETKRASPVRATTTTTTTTTTIVSTRPRGRSHAPPPRGLSSQYEEWSRSARLVLAIVSEHMSPLAEASTTTDLMQVMIDINNFHRSSLYFAFVLPNA
jgi:hypothetical protein